MRIALFETYPSVDSESKGQLTRTVSTACSLSGWLSSGSSVENLCEQMQVSTVSDEQYLVLLDVDLLTSVHLVNPYKPVIVPSKKAKELLEDIKRQFSLTGICPDDICYGLMVLRGEYIAKDNRVQRKVGMQTQLSLPLPRLLESLEGGKSHYSNFSQISSRVIAVDRYAVQLAEAEFMQNEIKEFSGNIIAISDRERVQKRLKSVGIEVCGPGEVRACDFFYQRQLKEQSLSSDEEPAVRMRTV